MRAASSNFYRFFFPCISHSLVRRNRSSVTLDNFKKRSSVTLDQKELQLGHPGSEETATLAPWPGSEQTAAWSPWIRRNHKLVTLDHQKQQLSYPGSEKNCKLVTLDQKKPQLGRPESEETKAWSFS